MCCCCSFAVQGAAESPGGCWQGEVREGCASGKGSTAAEPSPVGCQALCGRTVLVAWGLPLSWGFLCASPLGGEGPGDVAEGLQGGPVGASAPLVEWPGLTTRAL